MGAEIVEPWSAELESLLMRVGHRFGRRDLRQRMRDYVHGLLGPVGRKNGWQLAEYAGHATPDGFQRLLASSVWDPDELRNDICEFVGERLGEADGVLIVDDTGFVKKGVTSAGVGRQYTGTSGKVDNCQVGVFAAYASRRGRALVDRELYLPKSWTGDPERCEAARIPAGRVFATKHEIARAMVTRILAAGMPVGWVAADEAYGGDYKFRRACEDLGVGYVVAVPKSQQVATSTGFGRIDALVGHAPPEAWLRMSCGDGAKGPRVYDWTCARLPAVPDFDDEEHDRGRWLLSCRSLADPTEIAYYLAAGPADTPLAELVRVAGARWAIEECFQAAKNQCGLDEYEVRRYPGWYRHITLAMLAHAFLAALAADAAQKGEPTPPNPMLCHSAWRRSGDSWQL